MEGKGREGSARPSNVLGAAHRRKVQFVQGPAARNLVAPTCTADATYLWLTEDRLGEGCCCCCAIETQDKPWFPGDADLP